MKNLNEVVNQKRGNKICLCRVPHSKLTLALRVSSRCGEDTFYVEDLFSAFKETGCPLALAAYRVTLIQSN